MNMRSLEDTIRAVSNQHKNRPSPLSFLDPEKPIPVAPQQVTPKTESNFRNKLLSGFKPKNDTF